MERKRVSADIIGTDIDVDTASIFVHEPVDITPFEKETIENDDEYKKLIVKIDDLVPTQRTVNMRRVKDALDSKNPVRVWDDNGTLKLVDGHHRTALRKLNGAASIPAFVCKRSVTAAASKPAPKKDRIKGSKTNKPGSAKTGAKVKFSAKVETALRNKLETHNKKVSPGRKATMSQLKAVYRRGAGAYSSSHRPGVTRDQWAMARVNAYLRLLSSGKPAKAGYTQDNDLLPASHPKSSKKNLQALVSSGLIPEEQALADALVEVVSVYGKFDQDGDGVWAGYTPAYENEVAGIGVKCANCVFYDGGNGCAIISLEVEPEGKCRFAVLPEGAVSGYDVPLRRQDDLELLIASAYAEAELEVSLLHEDEYDSPEQALLAMAELSGEGYEIIPALRAAWLRGVREKESPFRRASQLAAMLYDSKKDTDLLPVVTTKEGLDK